MRKLLYIVCSAVTAVTMLPFSGNAQQPQEPPTVTEMAAEEAERLAQLLSMMFNLEPRHGQKSEFGGPYFECMKAPFLGTNGHIAMRTPDLTAAVEELKEKGFTFNMETAAYNEDGTIKNVYLDGEYGGFAIHIMQK